MKPLLFASCLAATACSAAVGLADSDFGIRLARTVAPFVDGQTLAVVHADLGKFDAMKTVAMVGDLLHLSERERGHTQADLAPLDVFNSSLAEGVSADVFVVIGMADLSSLPFFFVLPVDSPARALAGEIRRALADTQKIEVAAEQIGNAVIAGSRQTLDRLKKAKPTNRPEIAAGFQVTADHAAQVLFVPSPDMRRLIGVLMPTLPAIVGGGSTKAFTQGIVWAAVGLDLPPKAAAMHVVVQSTSPEAAQLLNSELTAMSTTIGLRPEVREQIPNFAELMARLAPQVSGDQLMVEVSEDDGDMAEWSSILLPLLKAARSATPPATPTLRSPAE